MKHIDIEITAESGLELLTNDEIARLSEHSKDGDHELFKKCVLAVLNSTQVTDEISYHKEQLKNFDVEVVPLNKGVKLKIKNAPNKPQFSLFRCTVFNLRGGISYDS